MKIAILFTLIGLSLCQDALIPTLSCIKKDCREKIKAVPDKDISNLVNNVLCDATNFDADVKEFLEDIKCVLCGLDDITLLVQELLTRIQKADLVDPKCKLTKVIEGLTGLLGGDKGLLGSGAGPVSALADGK